MSELVPPIKEKGFDDFVVALKSNRTLKDGQTTARQSVVNVLNSKLPEEKQINYDSFNTKMDQAISDYEQYIGRPVVTGLQGAEEFYEEREQISGVPNIQIQTPSAEFQDMPSYMSQDVAPELAALPKTPQKTMRDRDIERVAAQKSAPTPFFLEGATERLLLDQYTADVMRSATPENQELIKATLEPYIDNFDQEGVRKALGELALNGVVSPQDERFKTLAQVDDNLTFMDDVNREKAITEATDQLSSLEEQKQNLLALRDKHQKLDLAQSEYGDISRNKISLCDQNLLR